MKMHIIGTGTATVSKYINTSCVFEEDNQLFLVDGTGGTLGRGQARGGAPVQHGPHHDAPPAGPPCPHRTDLPRLHHQRGDEVS